MNKITAPVFIKDFKLIGRHAIAALAVQLFILVFIPILNEYIFSRFRSYHSNEIYTYEWFPKVQLAVNAIIALIAAAYWSAEERAGKHDRLLRRIPITKTRLWSEKTLAGLAVIALVLIIQSLWSFCIVPSYLWHDHLIENFTILTLATYCIGLPISCLVVQSINVIVLGLPVSYLLQAASYYAAKTETLQELRGMVLFAAPWIILIACIITAAHYATRRSKLAINGYLWSPGFHFRRELLIVSIFSIAFLIYAIIYTGGNFKPGNNFIIIMFSIWLFVPLVIGAMAFRAEDKNGLQCMMYHYALPRMQIFWSKFCYGAIPAVIVNIAFIILFVHFTPHIMSMLGNDRIYMERYYNFATGHTYFFFFCIGMLPYCCSALISLSVNNPIYVFMESIPAAVIALCLYIFLQYGAIIEIGFMYPLAGNGYVFPTISGELLLMLILLSCASWAALCDRHFMSGGALERQLGVWRLFFFALAATYIIVRTGVKDLIYLVLGLDFGAY